ncbi:MAG: hypothetical protein ABJD11_08560 [Gemmatimonadota bacterium]
MFQRRWWLSLGALAALLAVGSCSLDESAAGPGGPGAAGIKFTAPLPRFSRVGPTLAIEQLRVTITRPSTVIDAPPTDTLAARTFPFDVNAVALNASLPVLLINQAEQLDISLSYETAQSIPLFFTQQRVLVHTGAPAPAALPPPVYIGPGFNIAALNLTPLDTTVTGGDSLLYQVSAIDANQQPVTSFYINWSTSDPRVTINALGLLRTPSISKVIDISATTPNSVVATTTVTVLNGGLGLLPDSVEKLPGGTQQFAVVLGGLRGATYSWSVNGVAGGNSTFGLIDTTGLYTAPSVIPSPSTFSVCATQVGAPTITGCARIVLLKVPSAGADLIVINDQNLFDSIPMRPDSGPYNARFAKNLFSFSGTGPRSSGNVIYYDRGRNAPCFSVGNQECGDGEKARFDSVLVSAGFTIQKFDTIAAFTSIPPNVKAIVLWMPTVSYTTADINSFKNFAAQGGRIIFIGERLGFYLQTGIDLENQFLADMGAQMTNVGADFDCFVQVNSYIRLPAASLRASSITAGMGGLSIACASEISPGPNDFPLFYDTSNQHVLAAVAKIDLTPIVPVPAPPSPNVRRLIAPARTAQANGKENR